MPKTLATLTTDVQTRLDELTPAFWTAAEIKRWIVEAARDVARRAECLMASSNITITAATQSYTAPTDCIRVHRAEWRPTAQSTVYPLEYRDYNSMDSAWGISQTITQGYPRFYTLWGFPPSITLLLYPTPSVGGTVKMFYYRLPADLATDGSADSSNVDVPDGWWDALVLYCEYIALRKDADQRWQEAKQLYEERLDALIGASRRWADAAGSMDYDNSAGLPYWLYGYDY